MKWIKLLNVTLAILMIGAVSILAILHNINGKVLIPSVIAIAGLGGWESKILIDKFKNNPGRR